VTAPLISIIVATYESATSIAACLESVVTQQFTDYELLVVDGGSQDGTVEIIQRYHPHIRWWVSEPDGGVYDAWNKALAQVRGEWFGFLGSDDQLAGPHVLGQLAVQLRAAEPQTDLIYGQVDLRAQGRLVMRLGQPWRSPWVWPWTQLDMVLPLAHPMAMHRQRVIERYGRFDTDFHIAGDTDYILRLTRTGPTPRFLPLLLVEMDSGGLSTQPERVTRLLEEMARIRRRYALPLGLGWHLFRWRTLLRGRIEGGRFHWLLAYYRRLRNTL